MDYLEVTVEFVFDRLGAVELAAAYQVLVPLRGRTTRPDRPGDGHDPCSTVRPGVLDPAETARDDRQPDRLSTRTRAQAGVGDPRGMGLHRRRVVRSEPGATGSGAAAGSGRPAAG